MQNAFPLLTVCLADPICVAGATGALSSLVAVARRLQSLDVAPRGQRGLTRGFRSCFVGAAYTGAASISLVILGDELWPGHLKQIASITVLASIALDWSSELAARLLRLILTAMARTYLKELPEEIVRPSPPHKSKDETSEP